jgi:acyl carrier protein
MDLDRPRLVNSASVLDAVLGAYRRVLDDPSVMPDDDFFDSGGDSMQALDVMAAIEEELDVHIDVATFFICPTAGDLGRSIAESAGLAP